jgi:NAD+ synthase (glutamine-hydrolysing)
MAQLNPVVGDIDGNVDLVLATLERASADRADLVVFPELIVTGYPPKDLLERPAFIDRAKAAVERVTEASKAYPGLGIVLGYPARTGKSEGKELHNVAALICEGKVQFEQAKMLLPVYDVFDEARYFQSVTDNAVVPFAGAKLGLSICEDLWYEPDPWNRRIYSCDPMEMLVGKGASLIINISASPFSMGKEEARYELIKNHARKHGLPLVFVNQVGGNDDLVFDGRSLYVDETGAARVVFPSFEEKTETIDTSAPPAATTYGFEEPTTAVYRALVLGTRDYICKCGLSKVVIGLSGGIDSAVTAAVARDAVGGKNMLLLAMPSPYSSESSVSDAKELAENLGGELRVIEIEGMMKAYESVLRSHFKGAKPDVTEENIQARIRGNLLMAISNKFGHLPLSTGNKSELAVGYCTLYGDMSGGLAVISDVPKTLVYRLAGYVNRAGTVIPTSIITKPPSAELKPDQKDQDVLPPYDILDRILEYYVDKRWSIDEIVEQGFDMETVEWVIGTVRNNEYKRKQAAPGLKVTSKAFGSGRRMPIAAKYDV